MAKNALFRSKHEFSFLRIFEHELGRHFACFSY